MKIVVVLGLSGLSVPEKIAKARSVVTSLTGNPAFAAPYPALPVVTAAINACETANIAAMSGGVDDTANMHAKETAMELQLKLLVAYVESIANVNPATAEAVVTSAGMHVRPRGGRRVLGFNAKATQNPGEIRLATKASQRCTYLWQMCEDARLEEWVTIGQGTRCSLVKPGLVTGRHYHFRVAVIDRNGQGPWSDVVQAMAH